MTSSEQTNCAAPDANPSTAYYKHGCRCPRCVGHRTALRNASMARNGGDRRVGVRAEQKRRWDREAARKRRESRS